MVGQGHDGNAEAAGRASQELMATLTPGHFEGNSEAASGLADIAASDDQRDSESAGGFADQAFIGVGGGTAQ